MNIAENRQSLEWLLRDFKNAQQYWKDVPEHELIGKFLDNKIYEENEWKKICEAEYDIHRRNQRLLRAIKSVKGKTFYKRLMEVIKESEGMRSFFLAEIVKVPVGKFQSERYGREIKGIWVDQRSVGMEGDSWEGTVCVEIKPNKYFKFHYSM